MQTNWKTSGIRPILFVGANLAAQGSTTQTVLRFRNQGNKRTGIWGYAWNWDDFHNETASALEIFQIWDIKEYLGNRKYLTQTLGRRTVQWLATSVDIPQEPNGNVTLPIPVIVKNADVTMQSNIYSGSATALVPRMWLFVSDIEIQTDMGDAFDSAKLNKGQRRAKNIGQTRAGPFMKGGVNYP